MQNSPIKEFRAGQIKATIWKNEKKNGKNETVVYKSATVEKSYKDDDGNWKTSNTFFREDLPKLQLVAAKAFEFISLTESQDEIPV